MTDPTYMAAGIFLVGVLAGMAITFACFWYGYHKPMMRELRKNVANQYPTGVHGR